MKVRLFSIAATTCLVAHALIVRYGRICVLSCRKANIPNIYRPFMFRPGLPSSNGVAVRRMGQGPVPCPASSPVKPLITMRATGGGVPDSSSSSSSSTSPSKKPTSGVGGGRGFGDAVKRGTTAGGAAGSRGGKKVSLKPRGPSSFSSIGQSLRQVVYALLHPFYLRI